MQLHTFSGQAVSNGVSVDVMVQAMDMEAKKAPGATLDGALIDWKAGKGAATIIKPDGSKTTQEFSDKPAGPRSRMKNVLLLAAGDTVQLAPENGTPFTVAVGNNTINTSVGLVDRPLTSSDPRPTDSPDQLDVRNWLATGRPGTSAKTIAHFLYGLPEEMSTSDYDGPYDPSDLVRCLKFIEAVPQARARIGELKEVRGWEQIAPNFAELEDLYKGELAEGTGKAPKLYDRMRQLRASPARKANKP